MGLACYSVRSPKAEQRGVSHLVGTPPTDLPDPLGSTAFGEQNKQTPFDVSRGASRNHPNAIVNEVEIAVPNKYIRRQWITGFSGARSVAKTLRTHQKLAVDDCPAAKIQRNPQTPFPKDTYTVAVDKIEAKNTSGE
jgi:hypothetical protein